MTLSVRSDCLPPDIKECELSVSAYLTTDIPLPSESLLISGVYHITTMPFIDRLNQPIEISMDHCANDISHLSFVAAKEYGQQKFVYMEGGTFEIDTKTGRTIGRMCVSSFSFWAIVCVRQIWEWLTSVGYYGGVYYDDTCTTSSHRNISFVITKDLPLAKSVRASHFTS